MNKVLRMPAIFAAISLLFSACFVELDPYAIDSSNVHGAYGNYTGDVTGKASGFKGPVTVTLSLIDGIITKALVTGPNETQGYGSLAIAQAPAIIVMTNKVELDTIAGASITTKAINTAGQAALAKVDPSLGGEPVTKMTPGTYGATANGYEGPFYVWVTVSENAITKIEFDEAHESPDIGMKAIPIVIDRILAAQSVGVDGVSGATLSSNALKEAVTEILENLNAPASMFVPPGDISKIDRQHTVDVLIIGSGAAGLSAAIEAKATNPSISVTILEKEEFIGGSTKLSAGIIYAAAGGSDKTKLKNYFLWRAQGYADSTLLDYYAQNSLELVDETWTAPESSAPGASSAPIFDATPSGVISLFMGTGTAGMSTDGGRARVVSGGGPALVNILEKRAKALGINILTGVKATKLEKSSAGGPVVRVLANSKTYNYVFRVRKGVIIATGGFDSDKEGLLKTYNSESQNDDPRSSRGNVGEGIKMGMEVGAKTVFKGGKIGWGMIDPKLNIDVMFGGNIITNKAVNLDLSAPVETVAADGTALTPLPVNWVDAYHNTGAPAGYDYPPMFTGFMRAREADPNVTFFEISNSPWAPSSLTSSGFLSHEYLESLHLAYSASDFAGLAEAMAHGSMDSAALSARFAERGWTDPETGVNGKYYAWKVMPSSIGSMGGLKINVDAKVLGNGTQGTSDGQPIVGLYAAGEAANGDFFYQQYPASGSSISLALTFGRVAGRNAAGAPNNF